MYTCFLMPPYCPAPHPPGRLQRPKGVNNACFLRLYSKRNMRMKENKVLIIKKCKIKLLDNIVYDASMVFLYILYDISCTHLEHNCKY